MTWLTVWDTDTWPHHAYAEHATQAEAEAAAKRKSLELGIEVSWVPVRGADMDEYAEAAQRGESE